jgi:hypothetical protein
MEVPVVEVFGPAEISAFFQNVYAMLYPAMPFLMIGAATALAGVLITVFRRIFDFETLTGKQDDYKYKEED